MHKMTTSCYTSTCKSPPSLACIPLGQRNHALHIAAAGSLLPKTSRASRVGGDCWEGGSSASHCNDRRATRRQKLRWCRRDQLRAGQSSRQAAVKLVRQPVSQCRNGGVVKDESGRRFHAKALGNGIPAGQGHPVGHRSGRCGRLCGSEDGWKLASTAPAWQACERESQCRGSHGGRPHLSSTAAMLSTPASASGCSTDCSSAPLTSSTMSCSCCCSCARSGRV